MRTDIYEILDHVFQSPGKMVLATIIDVQGSAYKKTGSTMLFREDGFHVGLLSGGCLEQDLFERVKTFFHEPSTTIITYDLSAEDDLSWGQGAGCNGIIKVFVETITTRLSKDIRKVRDLVNKGVNVEHIKRISINEKVIDYLFYTDNGDMFGQWKGEWPAVINLEDKTPLLHHNQGEMLFIQKFMARPRLIIYGAGIDAIPLAKLAHNTGFQVIVGDWRPAFCNKNHFPFANKTYIATPYEFFHAFTYTSSDSVVLMTHNYEKDEQLIHLFLEKKLGYLGILGSKVRAERLLRGVEIPNWVHFPVGLSIGAEGPQEIAVSVMAELIQNKTRRLDFVL
jgi:xanthine/CO dehydrogenase XdhC/CoxF family maturation factor